MFPVQPGSELSAPEYFKLLVQQANATIIRGTALAPMAAVAAFLGVLFAFVFVFELFVRAMLVTLIFVGVLFAIAFLITAFAYLYLLFNDRDALRSEKYNIKKMEIGRNMLGDTHKGVAELPINAHDSVDGVLLKSEAK